MKQLIQSYRSGKLEVRDVPAPGCQSGSILVATRYSLISSGTERASARIAQKSLIGKAIARPDLVNKVLEQMRRNGAVETAKMVFNRLDAPVAPGYSCAGIVLEVGADVTGIKPGDRVACGGQNHASHAEVVVVPQNLCVAVPAEVELQAASYVAVGAIALQGLRQASPQLGETVAVIGLGLLGQLTVQMLRASGCNVVCTDLDPLKIDLAKRFGAQAEEASGFEEHVAACTAGRGADTVLLTAGTDSDDPMRTAASICRKRGRIVVVGAVGMNLQREPFYVKELDLRLSTSYGPGRYDPDYEEKGIDYPFAYVRWTERRNMEAFIQLLAKRTVDAAALTTHDFPIECAIEAYKLLLEGKEPFLGVTLRYDRDEGERRHRTIEIPGPVRRASRIELGLIGAGSHVTDMLLPHLRARSELSIRGICTTTGMKSRALSDKVAAAYCTSDRRTILDDDSINAVLIGTQHDSHARVVIEALEAGKHVFVEKPLCLTRAELADVRRAYTRAAAEGLRLVVGLNRRFSPHATRLREAFPAGRGPLVMTYRVNAGVIAADHWIQDRRVGGGRIIGEGCHFIDLMQFVCGGKPCCVSASSVRGHPSGITNDQSIAIFDFSDGSVGSLVYASGGDRALAKERFEVFGRGKSAVLDDFTTTEVFARGRRTRFQTRRQDKGFAAEMAVFCDCIVNERVSLPSFDEIEATTLASIAADEALQRGESAPPSQVLPDG
jgi:predicted dehydrogenase/threonine dehydrogenase-like Zn-dependent dehydrogenase